MSSMGLNRDIDYDSWLYLSLFISCPLHGLNHRLLHKLLTNTTGFLSLEHLSDTLKNEEHFCPMSY